MQKETSHVLVAMTTCQYPLKNIPIDCRHGNQERFSVH